VANRQKIGRIIQKEAEEKFKKFALRGKYNKYIERADKSNFPVICGIFLECLNTTGKNSGSRS
jgi:hypothetical protein